MNKSRKLRYKCDWCKKIFFVPPRNYRRNPRVYCSVQCAALYRGSLRKGLPWKEAMNGNVVTIHSGPNHYAWKGGWVDNEGYKRIRVKGKDTLEHRYLMEQHLGEKLTYNDVVHHINGDKLDNRLENLQLMTRSEHSLLHHRILGPLFKKSGSGSQMQHPE